jgi:hypothetical protein
MMQTILCEPVGQEGRRMAMITKLKPPLRTASSQIFPLREDTGNGIPLLALLAQMDIYDWDSVEDMPINEDEKRRRLKYFDEVISVSGVGFNGSLLDIASGTTSLAYLYPDTVAVDEDPQKIKVLRRDGIKAVIADIGSLPFESKSFDYVVSFSPPQRPIILHSNSNGYHHFIIDQVYNRELVDATLRIARKKILIASHAIAMEPPYEPLIEKRGTSGYYYVLYRANNDPV